MEHGVLAEMADLLNSDGTNYSVFLKAYSGAILGTGEIGYIVSRLIGADVVVSAVRDSDLSEVVEVLRQCLGYVGDESAGPGASTLGSAEFSNLLKRILESVTHLSDTSYGLKSFGFLHGHPAYPVFWDFAYLFLGNDEHVLLVGSSSD
jgi:hypothetical protein